MAAQKANQKKGSMHVYPVDESQELWFKNDLVGIIDHPSNTLHAYRTKERFQNPSQGIIDRYSIGSNAGPWYLANLPDDTFTFYVLEEIGTVRYTEEGLEELATKAN